MKILFKNWNFWLFVLSVFCMTTVSNKEVFSKYTETKKEIELRNIYAQRYSLWAFLLPRSFQVFRVNSGSSASAYVEQWESLNWGIWVYGCWLPSSEVLCYLWHIWWPLLKLSSLWEGFWLMCGSHPCPRLEGTPITRDTVIRAVFTRGFPSLPGLLIWLDSQSAHPQFLTHWYTCEVTEKKKKKAWH